MTTTTTMRTTTTTTTTTTKSRRLLGDGEKGDADEDETKGRTRRKSVVVVVVDGVDFPENERRVARGTPSSSSSSSRGVFRRRSRGDIDVRSTSFSACTYRISRCAIGVKEPECHVWRKIKAQTPRITTRNRSRRNR